MARGQGQRWGDPGLLTDETDHQMLPSSIGFGSWLFLLKPL